MSINPFLLYDRNSERDRSLSEAVAASCIKNSHYDFVSGDSGGDYADVDEFAAGRNKDGSYDAVTAKERANELARHFAAKLQTLRDRGVTVDRLAFIERDTGPVGMLTYKDLIGVISQTETCSIRPTKRLRSSAIKGRPIASGEKVVIISDVATSGNALLAAAERVWECNAQVSCAVVVYDRHAGARQRLAQFAVDLYAIFDNDAWAARERETADSDSAPILRLVSTGRTS